VKVKEWWVKVGSPTLTVTEAEEVRRVLRDALYQQANRTRSFVVSLSLARGFMDVVSLAY
jgi:hypothetical protein